MKPLAPSEHQWSRGLGIQECLFSSKRTRAAFGQHANSHESIQLRHHPHKWIQSNKKQYRTLSLDMLCGTT